MPFASGTANSFSDLLTALRTACTDNGWTLSGDVLHKGTLYVETLLSKLGEGAGTLPANSRLSVRSGNGIDGSNNLTDAARTAGLGLLRATSGTSYPDWDWPVNYYIHVLSNPDEVAMFVQYDAGQRWQWVAFGQSPAPGNMGTGNWHSGSLGQTYGTDIYLQINRCAMAVGGVNYYVGNTLGTWMPAPFWMIAISNQPPTRAVNNSYIHGCINDDTSAVSWSRSDWGFNVGDVAGQGPQAAAAPICGTLLGMTPNAWNQETVLVPVQILQKRKSAKVSIVGEFQHIRMCRNDYIDPAGIITLGPDRWRVYPCHMKNVATRNGSNVGTGSGGRSDHTGTIAMAIRYDGP